MQIEGGKATPAPPIGPALGQHGLNIMKFCKEFNAKTKAKSGLILPVIIFASIDKTFTFIIKEPPASILLKKALGLDINSKTGTGSKYPGREFIGELDKEKIMKIAKQKFNDLNSYNIENAIKIISGTARSMGIKII